MKRLLNKKKLIFSFVLILLLGFDVTILFAAQTTHYQGNNNSIEQQQLQQVLQLQQHDMPPSSAQKPSFTERQSTPLLAQNENASPVLPAAGAATVPVPSEISNAPPPNSSQELPPQPNQQFSPPGSEPGPPPPVTLPPPQQPIQAPSEPEQPPPPTSGAMTEEQVSNAAFGAMTKNLLPMTPEQIQRLRQLFNQSQAAAAALPTTPARAVISSQFVNLAPGTTPPVIRFQEGMVSVLTFLDSTGAPWPIQAYDVGNPAAFHIEWNKNGNTLIIQPMSPYPYGNMAVILQGLSTPLILTLTAGQQAFDARIDLHVEGLGPNARAPIVTGLPETANPVLLCVLDGIPPPGSITLHVIAGKAQAWLCGGKLFVRTRYTILSPGWQATMSSADGMKAYELPKAPLLLATENGKIVQLRIEGV